MFPQDILVRNTIRGVAFRNTWAQLLEAGRENANDAFANPA
jgi:hypothetical protein